MPDHENPFRRLPPQPPPRVAAHPESAPRPAHGRSKAPAVMLGILAGAAAGGAFGALGRLLVGVVFFNMVAAGGGSFFGGSISPEMTSFLGVSALIGLVTCGIAGATCRSWIGAPIGALLSAMPCFVLVVFPSTFLMSMSGGNNDPDLKAVWLGLVGMVIVGALAGGVGGFTGKIVMRRIWPQT